MGVPEAHLKLDALLRNGKISSEAYFAMLDALKADADMQTERPTPSMPLLPGLIVNFSIQSLVMIALLCAYSVIVVHALPLISVLLYVLLVPASIAVYQIVFLPAGEILYQAVRPRIKIRRLPIYVTAAWILVLPMFLTFQLIN